MTNLSTGQIFPPNPTRATVFVLSISAAYLLLAYWLIGFRPEQLFVVCLFNSLYFISQGTRKFVLGFSVFLVYWILFDFMKAFPNYRLLPVHLESLYTAEKKIFGLDLQGQRLTPNEYWQRKANPFLNVLTGICYLMWIPVPLLFAAYLFYRERRQFFLFSFTFLLVNLLGFSIYYIYPAAPPWYVAEYGFSFHPLTPGNAAGLARFDRLFQTGVFRSIYDKSSNVFAAMPSLHAAYPLIVLYYGIKNNMRWINLLFALLAFGIWFSAVYNSHHYVLDILGGIACAGAGILLFRWMERHSKWLQRLVKKMQDITR
jgi:inositol phosphorylceramide synthase catalytic subunit